MNDLQQLLKKATKQNTLPAEVVYIREIGEGNTCTVQLITDTFDNTSYENMSNEQKIIAEQDFLYKVKYSVDEAKTVTTPEKNAYALLLYIDESKTSGIIISNSAIKDFKVGSEGEIVLSTSDTELSQTGDKTNAKSVLLLLANRFRVDLALDQGFFDFTGDKFLVTDVNTFQFENRCGNIIKIDCDGIYNQLIPGAKFSVSTSKTVVQKSSYSTVLNPYINNTLPDSKIIVNGLFNVLLFYSSLTSGKISSSDYANELQGGGEQTLDYYQTVLGNSYDLVAIGYTDESKQLEVFTALFQRLSNYYIVNYSSIDKYWHSEYKKFTTEITKFIDNNKLSTVNRSVLLSRLLIKLLSIASYRKFFAISYVYQPFVTTKLKGDFSELDVLFTYDNGKDYNEEKENGSDEYFEEKQNNVTISLKTIIDDLSQTVNDLNTSLTNLINAGVTTPSGAGTFTGGTIFLNEIQQIQSNITSLSSDVDTLLL